jgi:hypothetical protein
MIQKKTIIIWVAFVVIAVLFFFLWSEYKQYQLRKAFQDFWSELSNISNDYIIWWEIKGEEEKTIEVSEWESYIFNNGLKISMGGYENVWKTFEDDIWEYTAKNNFIVVVLFGENISQEPAFKYLWDTKIKLSDWTTYKNTETMQLSRELRPEWMWWCIECEMNPWDVSIQAILFDIPEDKDLLNAKILIENVAFNL